jgi:protein-S-isoprenylcysteine O-methyltransferase Ste14
LVIKLLGGGSSPLSLQGIRTTAPFFISLVLILCSAFVRLSCYHTLGNFFTFRIALRKGHQLITTGPYAYVRHPSYTAIVILLFSATHAFFSPGSWAYEILGLRWKSEALIMIICAGPSVFVSLDRSIKEDEMLKNQFGAEWDEWAKRVPYRLVPYVW